MRHPLGRDEGGRPGVWRTIARLHEQGILTAEELEAQKARILGALTSVTNR
jgi:hypothetical protein